MYTEEYNDDMHKLIVERLKERNRKLEFINRLEKPSRIIDIKPLVGILVAACFIGFIFYISPWSFDDATNTPYRSSEENIQGLIDSGNHEKALIIIENEILSVDSALNVLKQQENNTDEEIIYEIKVHELKKEDLIQMRDELKNILKK